MNKYHLSAICIIIISASLIPHADSWIPPTRAFEKFFSGSNHIEAKTWNGGLNFTCTGCTITENNGTTRPQINFNITASNSPIIVSTISLLNQTANIATTTLYTAPNNGQYHVSVYQVDSQSGIAGTLSSIISWTDETGTAQTQSPAPNLSLALLDGFSNGISFIDVKSGTVIKYQTSLSGVTGSPKYDLFIIVEKLS